MWSKLNQIRRQPLNSPRISNSEQRTRNKHLWPKPTHTNLIPNHTVPQIGAQHLLLHTNITRTMESSIPVDTAPDLASSSHMDVIRPLRCLRNHVLYHAPLEHARLMARIRHLSSLHSSEPLLVRLWAPQHGQSAALDEEDHRLFPPLERVQFGG